MYIGQNFSSQGMQYSRTIHRRYRGRFFGLPCICLHMSTFLMGHYLKNY